MTPGERIDNRFVVEKLVATGGMGVVYRAQDTQTGQPVALKVLETRSAEDVIRAIQEVELLAKVNHPGIVRHIADGLTKDDVQYLAMEWIEGPTIADRMEKDGFSQREVVEVGRAVAAGLGAAHAHGIIHRDIKPTNIILEGNECTRARVIDFGLARLAGPGQRSLTRTGMTLGTPGYMAPEQARGRRDLLPAVDVFCLATILYECLTATAAFTGSSLASLMANVILAEPTPILDIVPTASPDLAAAITQMLVKDPTLRVANGNVAVAVFDALADIPDGPRRRRIESGAPPTVRAHTGGAVATHGLVLATRGFVDDIVDPPAPSEQALLHDAAAAVGAVLEVLATGSVVVHFAGTARDIAARAARCALAIKHILPQWAVAISTLDPALTLVSDAGTDLLGRAAKAAIFAKTPEARGAILVDPQTANYLDGTFEIDRTSPPRLRGVKR
ncbi:MAG: serine/threonine protein kinase [Deltaproteobacteria bacterium]|nr:serine/threonine protein kinase [Deltaproteobacteria bacterium]